jgi:3-dehydroquinate synthase class II
MEDIKLDDISDSVELKDYIIQEMQDWKIGRLENIF